MASSLIQKIKNSRLSKSEQKEQIESLRKLRKGRLPIILSTKDLAQFTNSSSRKLASMANATFNYYRSFEIPKRSGGTRTIQSPFPSLAQIQRWISAEIIERLPINSAATAYLRRTSIKDHVERHINQECLLKLDIQSFFPSIKRATIERLFTQIGYTKSVSRTISYLLTLDGSLPQGAPSSPCLSNAIMEEIDHNISALCKKHQICYSRYADDFAFSGDDIPSSFISEVEVILNIEGFSINPEKTRVYSKKERTRFLTGVVVNGFRMRPSKHFRRTAMQKLFYLERFIFSDLEQNKSPVPQSELLQNIYLIDSLKGKFLYWNWLDSTDEKAATGISRILAIESSLAST